MAGELGREIEYHQAIGSTQDRARERAAATGVMAARLVVVADAQTAGQGTRGRVWHAPAGTALLASWLFRPAPDEPALVGLLAGVAVARALDALGAPGARLKWPNDVLLDDRKLAGVLSHGTSDSAGGTLVLGIGVNVHQVAAELPEELGGRATSLALAGHAVDRLALLVRLTAELDRVAVAGGRSAALDEWRGRAALLGRTVEVRREGAEPVTGIARDIAEDGALVVETAYGREHIHAGEVTVRI